MPHIKTFAIFVSIKATVYARNLQILRYNNMLVLLRPQSATNIFSYGDYECTINILDRVVSGQAPARVIAKVSEWVDLHESEILTLWERAQRGEPLHKLEPLK